MKLYLAVTKDRYELPIAVAGSVAELSRMLGVPDNNIYSSLSKQRHGRIRKDYREVEVDE